MKAWRASCVWIDRSVVLGRYWRIKPLVFAQVGCYQGLCESEKYMRTLVAAVSGVNYPDRRASCAWAWQSTAARP